jgi:tetratricopeptide (TPR) repeat protein
LNKAEAVECVQCGFPLGEHAIEPASSTDPAAPPHQPEAAAAAAGEAPTPAAPDPVAVPRIPRPARFRPRPRRVDPTSATLWIVFGGFAAMVVLWVAIQATLKKAGPPPIPGSNEVLQATADSLNRVLGRDSTDVNAHQKLADIYYDTGNWEPAIVQYRAVVRCDSTRTPALVDLGVCYFNLGDGPTAEALFSDALAHDPHHPVALFNLGIVYEARKEYRTSLDYFRRCLASDPPEAMRAPVQQSIDRVQLKLSGRGSP